MSDDIYEASLTTCSCWHCAPMPTLADDGYRLIKRRYGGDSNKAVEWTLRFEGGRRDAACARVAYLVSQGHSVVGAMNNVLLER